MNERKDFFQAVEGILDKDKRYKADAYEFVAKALHFTQDKLKRNSHITGKELLEGIREFAIEEYGPMAKTVLAHWGIKDTLDFGSIVFNMVDNKLLSKTEEDSIEDFRDGYDFDLVFDNILKDVIIKDEKE